MSVRFFTHQQKRHLYLVAEGRCERCDEPLSARWAAHHERRFVDGGVTEITNGAALCERCHVRAHGRVKMVEPRGWQTIALPKFMTHEPDSFLLDATPGSGKTIFAALVAARLFAAEAIDFVLIVVPTIPIKGGFLTDWHNAGIEITTVLKDGTAPPTEFKGGVVTYSQLVNLTSSIDVWKRNGLRIFVVFDEIHHASEDNTWGYAAEQTGRGAIKILAMTGTAFRGDRHRISFVRYGADGKATADHTYSYAQAVADRVCREIEFMTDDGIAEFVRGDEENGRIERSVRISEVLEDEDLSGATHTVFRSDSQWLDGVIAKADDCLDAYRTWDADAGGLVICRPGSESSEDNAKDTKHLRQVAALIERATGERPELISYDDKDATAKIDAFRKSKRKWICAVRKISEGVDIPRLRVEVLACRPTTELLFRQLGGRVCRVDNPKRPGTATMFIAKFPQLCEWAARIRAEAEAGLAKTRDGGGGGERQPGYFTALSATHEDGGAISDYGEEYSASEINAAERDKRDDPQLIDIGVTTLAYLRRKHGVEPAPFEPPSEPLQVQKKKVRTELNKLTRRLAYRLGPEEDYQQNIKRVWIDLHKHTGAKSLDDLTDNYSTDVMRQALDLVKLRLGGQDAGL